LRERKEKTKRTQKVALKKKKKRGGIAYFFPARGKRKGGTGNFKPGQQKKKTGGVRDRRKEEPRSNILSSTSWKKKGGNGTGTLQSTGGKKV